MKELIEDPSCVAVQLGDTDFFKCSQFLHKKIPHTGKVTCGEM